MAMKDVELIESEGCGYFVQDGEGIISIQIQNPGQPMLVLDRFPIPYAHIFALYIDDDNDVRMQLVKGDRHLDFSLFDMVTKLEELGMPVKRNVLS